MRTRIQKWGNSLAVRIPKAFAAEVGLESESAVEVSMQDGCLVIAPIKDNPYTLEGLLAQVTDENLHPETSTGRAVGNEVW